MNLHVSNFTDFQLLKYDEFKAYEQVFNIEDSIKDVIKLQNIAAKQRGISIKMKRAFLSRSW